MPKDAEDFHDAQPELNRVGVRVPPFYPQKPALWFMQLESQFALANITSDATKYHHAFGQLDPQYAAEVEDVISSSSFANASNKYQLLKTELIKRLSASREKKVRQLLTSEELGDQKPSQFLRRLKSLAGPDIPDDFLRSIWSSRLPKGTQTIIASQAKLPLDEVAELADQIHDVVTPSPQVAAAEVPTGSQSTMAGQIAELTRQVHALSTKFDRMSRSRPRARSTSRASNAGRTRTRSQSNYRKFPVCWYHAKFGDQASRCTKPCDYAGNAKGSR